MGSGIARPWRKRKKSRRTTGKENVISYFWTIFCRYFICFWPSRPVRFRCSPRCLLSSEGYVRPSHRLLGILDFDKLNALCSCFFFCPLFLAQVSVVTFGPKKVKDRNVGKMTVRGKGWDATVGGWWFDLKLTDVFAERFNAKVGFQCCISLENRRCCFLIFQLFLYWVFEGGHLGVS